jgi:hypothetical protein
MTAPEPDRPAGNALVGWLATGGAVVAGAVMLAALGPLFGDLPPSLAGVQAAAPPVPSGNEENRRITAAEFAEVVEGMSYQEAARRIGDPGKAEGSATLGGVSATAYVWTNDDGSQAAIIFRQGKMAMKTQSGL